MIAMTKTLYSCPEAQSEEEKHLRWLEGEGCIDAAHDHLMVTYSPCRHKREWIVPEGQSLPSDECPTCRDLAQLRAEHEPFWQCTCGHMRRWHQPACMSYVCHCQAFVLAGCGVADCHCLEVSDARQ